MHGSKDVKSPIHIIVLMNTPCPLNVACSLWELKTRNLWRHKTKVSFIKGNNNSDGNQWTAGIEMRAVTG